MTGGEFNRHLLDIFLDRAPLGIAVFDRACRLQWHNQTWAGFLARHVGVPYDYVSPGRSIAELLAGGEQAMVPMIKPALAGEVVRDPAHRLENQGVVTYWDVVCAPTYRDGEVVGFVNVVTDATDGAKAYHLLQRRIDAFATVASSMTVDQPLEVTLRALADTAARVTEAEACAVVIVESDSGLVSVFEASGLPPAYGEAMAESWRQGVQSPTREALENQRLTVVTDARAKGLENRLYAPIHPYLRRATWDDMVVVPLDTRGRCLGVMQYYHRGGRTHDADERSFLTALADQAALAVANASLYAHSERHAALLERQRLARELHDSVSQALFAMTLHARTAERQLAAEGVHPDAAPSATVRRLADLAQGAVAEMRALIFELRPGALAEEGLVTALTRQAAAFTAREGIPIDVAGPAHRPILDVTVEEQLYRLTLEALNNAVKHSQAPRITVDIVAEDDGALRITVSDNGVGFNPTQVRPGHLGQSTMNERAAAIAAELRVTSSPGAGCTVTVTVPATQ